VARRYGSRISSKRDLPIYQFDGVFANAALFHVPSQSCRACCWTATQAETVAFFQLEPPAAMTRKVGTAECTAYIMILRRGAAIVSVRIRRWPGQRLAQVGILKNVASDILAPFPHHKRGHYAAVRLPLDKDFEQEAGTRDAAKNPSANGCRFRRTSDRPKSRPSPSAKRRWSESRPVASPYRQIMGLAVARIGKG